MIQKFVVEHKPCDMVDSGQAYDEIADRCKELGINKAEFDNQSTRQRITPESISDVLGNTAGQQD